MHEYWRSRSSNFWINAGLNSREFAQILCAGSCADDEPDYLDLVATDITVKRTRGLGRNVSVFGDLQAFRSLVSIIRQYRPHIIHTHTAKAGFLGWLASLISFHDSIRIHTFHGHST